MPISIPTVTEVVTDKAQVRTLAKDRQVQVPMHAPSDWEWYVETTADEICVLLDEALETGCSLLARDDGKVVFFSINDDPAQPRPKEWPHG